MRKNIMLIVMLAAICAAGFGEEGKGFFDNFDFKLSSTPTELGNITKGYLGYRFSDDFSSSVRLKTELSSQLDSNSTSLVATKNTNLFLDIYLLEFRLNPAGVPVKIGAGANITKQNVEQKGYDTDAAVSNTIVFSNIYEVIFYSPKVSASLSFNLPIGDLDYSFSYSPIYFYNLNQTIELRPLIADSSTFAFQGSGSPYIENNAIFTLMDLLQVQFIHEYQKIGYSMLGIGVSNGAYVFVSTPSEFEITSLSLIGSLVFDIQGLGEVTLGGGRNFSITRDLKNISTPVAESQYNVFDIGFKTSL